LELTKEQIIAWRTSLKGGKNLPLRIIFDNQFNFDESLPLNYIKWDDDKGIIYIFRLTNMSDTIYPGNNPNTVSVFSAPYDKIWYMTLAIPLEVLDDVFDSIGSISDDFKEYIKYGLTEALHPDRWRMEHADINAMVGAKATHDDVAYYMGRFPEPFKETRPHAMHNEWIKQQKENNQDDPSNP
jgi:hypothetical protein